jgi:hypothetical protein
MVAMLVPLWLDATTTISVSGFNLGLRFSRVVATAAAHWNHCKDQDSSLGACPNYN